MVRMFAQSNRLAYFGIAQNLSMFVALVPINYLSTSSYNIMGIFYSVSSLVVS